jgi:hypothetical protein
MQCAVSNLVKKKVAWQLATPRRTYAAIVEDFGIRSFSEASENEEQIIHYWHLISHQDRHAWI